MWPEAMDDESVSSSQKAARFSALRRKTAVSQHADGVFLNSSSSSPFTVGQQSADRHEGGGEEVKWYLR